jgi:carboxypeptidase family protein/TonB-dependent receptor-like protein
MVACSSRALRSALLGGAATGLLAGTVHAQAATGKLEGRVQDAVGAPLAQAQLRLVGMAFGAETDARGYYFINNIPAGTYRLHAVLIGFQPVQVTGLRILADQTITQDFTLAAAALQLREITVIAAENPLVPRDEVTTKQRIDGQFADALPVDRLNDILALQPGVVEVIGGVLSGGRVATERGLSIRGSRETQNVTYVDGVPVQPGYKGDRIYGWRELGPPGTALEIGTNAVEEASVTTGSPSAAFGNANAGIISIVTRTGGGEYHGSLSYQTDEPFGVAHGPGINRLEGAVSGPLAGRLTFAVSGTLEGRQSVEEGFDSQRVPIFLPAGVDTTVVQPSMLAGDTLAPSDDRHLADTTLVSVYDYAVSRGRCDAFATAGSAGLEGPDGAYIRRLRDNFGLQCNGVRLPATARTLYTAAGKLNYTYGAGSRLTLSVAASRNHGERYDFIIRHLNRLSLANTLRGFSNRSRVATLTWAPNLSKSAERALALDVSLSYQEDRTIGGQLTGESAQSTRSPFGGFILRPMRFLFDFDNFPIDERLIRNIRVNEPGIHRIHPIEWNNPSLDGVDDLRNDAYGLYGMFAGFGNSMGGDTWTFRESGGYSQNPINLYAEHRYVGKATLDWQADRYSRLKLGAELTRYDIANFGAPLRFPGEAYLGRPIRWNAFLEDRLDLGDVVVVGGLRYDRYDTRAFRPYVTDTAGNHYQFPRISSLPGFDPANPMATFVRDRAHGYLSPRVQVSFPVTDRTNFRLSYAHQVQTPDLGLLLSGINMDLSVNNVGQAVGADLDFGKTIAFEFGIRHAFSDDMVLDVAAYNKNIIADPAARVVTRFDPATGRDVKFNIMTNLDFGSVRGLDVRLDRRFGQLFNGTIAYAYQYARNTGSDPFTYIYYGSFITDPTTGQTQPPPQGTLPTDDSRPHALTAAFSITFPGDWKRGSPLGEVLRNVSVFSTFRYTSGSAYSRCSERTDDQSVLSSENCIRSFPEGINTQRLPPFKELNARLVKTFALGRLDVSGYLDVRNLLNIKNILEVFATNGSLRNDVERAENLKADLADLAAERDINVALGAVGADRSLVLPIRHEDCATWRSDLQFRPAAANCMYLIRAEQRFGDGDGVFTIEEQSRAINALYDVARGEHAHTAPGRRARVGLEIAF